MQVLSDLHTRRPPTQRDICQMMYWYNWFSWWWALGCSKHVQKWNKHIKKCVKLVINTTWVCSNSCWQIPLYYMSFLLFTDTFLFSCSYFNMRRAYRKLFFLNVVSSLLCILLLSLILSSCVKQLPPLTAHSVVSVLPYLSTGTSHSTSINLSVILSFSNI